MKGLSIIAGRGRRSESLAEIRGVLYFGRVFTRKARQYNPIGVTPGGEYETDFDPRN